MYLYQSCCVLMNYMEQNPFWEANSRSTSQEIPCLLWNPKVHCHIPKSPPLVRIQSKPSYPVSRRSILIISSHLHRRLPGFLLLRFSNEDFICISLLPICATYPAHLIFRRLVTVLLFCVQITKFFIMHFSTHSLYFLPLRYKYSQEPVIKHPEPEVLLCGRPIVTPIYITG
jgi:hypothetical protein